MDNQQIKNNLLSPTHWMRLIYMLLFAVCLQVASFVMWVVVIVQFVFALITGEDNVNLRHFGRCLSRYIHQSLLFLTYNSETKPFPFADWPNCQDDAPEPKAPPSDTL